jgi:HAMP domain-containing protein
MPRAIVFGMPTNGHIINPHPGESPNTGSDSQQWHINLPSRVVEVNRNKRILLGIIAVFTGLTAGAAVLMADRLIARPVLGIARTAADIEAEKFELDSLGAIAQRHDEIGQLARVFDRMAQQVYSREQKLKQQVRELRIEIDETKCKKQVEEIVESDFFQDLTAKAQALRRRQGNGKSVTVDDPPSAAV